MVSPQRLNLAGWLSVTNAVVSIPIMILSVVLGVASEQGGASGFGARAATVFLTIVSTGLFVYIFSTLRALLEERYTFHETSALITIMIGVSVVIAGLGLLGVLSSEIATAVGVLSLIALVPFGIIYVVFAIKLLRLPNNLHGMLKPFSYLSIATGFGMATVLLFPLAVLTGAVSDVVLAIIFFRAIDGSAA